jgi:hypothetical protein
MVNKPQRRSRLVLLTNEDLMFLSDQQTKANYQPRKAGKEIEQQQ